MADYNEIKKTLGDALRQFQDDLNVSDYFPKSVVPPAAVIQPAVPTISYIQARNSPTAQWRFSVMLIVGQVNEEAAQLRIGEFISPGSPLIEALNAIGEDSGFLRVKVTDASVSEVQVGTTNYAYARLSVVVDA